MSFGDMKSYLKCFTASSIFYISDPSVLSEEVIITEKEGIRNHLSSKFK